LLGGWIDRKDKRALMVGADIFRFVLVATITVAGLAGDLTITHLGLVAALGGAASSLFHIASHAYLPVIIGREQLVDGNAKLSATDSAAEIAGPGLAGVLIDLLTAPIAVLLDAVSYLWSAAYLLRIQRREERHPDAATAQGLGSPLEGLRIIWRHPLLRMLLLSFGTWAFFGGFFFSLYMLYTLKTLGLSNTTVGFVISFGGIGALGGALLARQMLERLGPGPAITLAWTVCQLSALFIPFASVGPKVPFLILHQLLSDGFMMAAIIMSVSLRQSIIPQHQLGRAAGAFDFAEGSMMPLGIVISGVTAEIIGVTPTVLIGVLGGLSVPLLLALSPVMRLKEMPRSEATP
jgi:MFS family permease